MVENLQNTGIQEILTLLFIPVRTTAQQTMLRNQRPVICCASQKRQTNKWSGNFSALLIEVAGIDPSSQPIKSNLSIDPL